MANSREVTTVRKLIAAVLGTVAAFVILFGAGMTSLTIMALGVALLVLAVALVLVSTVRTGARAWVTGEAQVHSVSEPPAAYAFGRCELQIVIDAPGLPPRSVKVIDPRVPVVKWPHVGATLPVKVAIDDQRHVRILWDEVPTHAEAAAMADLPGDYDGYDPVDDDPLTDEDTPPWARRGSDDDGYPAPDPDDPDARPTDDGVVVHHGPGGTIVVEGTLVEPPPASPLPRRAAPVPRGGDVRPPGSLEAAGDGPANRGTGSGVPAQPGPADRTGEPVTTTPPGTAEPVAGPHAAEPAPVATTPADAPPVPAQDEPVGAPAAPRARTGGDPLDDNAGADRVDDNAGADRHGTDTDVTGGGHDDPVDDVDIDLDLGGPPPGRVADGTAAAGSGPISGVGITLLVTDLDRSVGFYRDMLGFTEIDRGESNAVLTSGGTRLVLRAIRDVAPINRRVVHLNLEVGDVEAAHEQLRGRGVRFTYAPRVVNRGERLELWAAAFRDPDGHGIALTQWRDRPVAPAGRPATEPVAG